MLFKRISDQISEYFVQNQVIEAEKRAIYAYGLELLISSLASVVCAGCLAIILGDFAEYLCFLCAFIPFRLCAGGYHADSHEKCIVCFTGMYCIGFIMRTLFWMNGYVWMSGIAVLIATLLILLFAPIGHPNKKLSIEKRKKNRKRSILLAAACLLGACVVSGTPEEVHSYFMGFFSGEFLAAVSLAVGKIRLKRGHA